MTGNTSQNMKTREEIAAAAKANAAVFLPTIPPEILNPARRILEGYSGVAPEEVEAHILDIREKAWNIFPYGCIGSFTFLNLQPTLQDPLFQTVAARLRAPDSTETFLDVGCCLGSVLRHLISDGVSASRLYGTDLQPGFLELGYDLFCDRDRDRDGDKINDDEKKQKQKKGGEATYIAGDMLSPTENELDSQLKGKIDVIYASAFFHLFEREGQVQAAKRMVGFLRPENEEAMIFGCNGGPKIQGWEKYVLDAEGWKGVWDEVGRATGTAWRSEVVVVEESEAVIKVRFVVYRAV